MSAVIHAVIGAITGVLSAFGLGGGTLLLLWLTLAAGFPQATAQGINLLYFLPSAGAALPSHLKNGMIDRRAALWAGVFGCLGAIGGAWLASALETGILRKGFGCYLLVTGVLLLRKRVELSAQADTKPKKSPNADSSPPA